MITTLKFIEKELGRAKINLVKQVERNSPEKDIANIKAKIRHYEKICDLLRKEIGK